MTNAAGRSRGFILLMVGSLLAMLASAGWAQSDLSGALSRVSDSVFTLKGDLGHNKASVGTGFVVTADGQALTCRHVVEGTQSLLVTFADKSTTSAEVVAADEDHDLALLKLERTGLPPVTFGSSEALKSGADVAAVGAPFGLENSVTKGVVSSAEREVNGKRYLQISAQLNPGNSGGPVINTKGEVVGVANAIVKGGEGVGFAIPAAAALAFLQEQKVTVATGLGVKPAEAESGGEGGSASVAPAAPPTPVSSGEVVSAVWPLLAGTVLISLLLALLVANVVSRGVARRALGGGAVPPPVPPAPWGQPQPGAPPPPQPPADDLSDIDITLQ